MAELAEFHEQFFQHVQGLADARRVYLEDAFFEAFCDELVECGDIETAKSGCC